MIRAGQLWGLVAIASLSSGCFFFNSSGGMNSAAKADALAKGRSLDGAHYVTVTYSKGGDERGWVRFSANDPQGGDWKAYGAADELKVSVGSMTKEELSAGDNKRYYWEGRHHTWYRGAKDSNGNLQSDGWMDTEGLQDGKGGMRLSGPYKVGDWRTYADSHNGAVLETGVYRSMKDPRDSMAMISVKDGVWRKFDYSALRVETVTWKMGTAGVSGSEPWPDFSQVAGRYKVVFPQGHSLVANIDKTGKLTVESSAGAWPNGTSFWLHRNPFSGQITTTNFRTNGHIEHWSFDAAGASIGLYSAWNFPYGKPNAVVTAPRL